MTSMNQMTSVSRDNVEGLASLGEVRPSWEATVLTTEDTTLLASSAGSLDKTDADGVPEGPSWMDNDDQSSYILSKFHHNNNSSKNNKV